MKHGTILAGMREAIQSAENRRDELRESFENLRRAAAETQDPLYRKTLQTDASFLEIDIRAAEEHLARLQGDLGNLVQRN